MNRETLGHLRSLTPPISLNLSAASTSLGFHGREIILENRTLSTGVLLALLVVFVVSYTRSPWQKLPPSPKRIPIIGNVRQLLDKKWLFSRECKERFCDIMYLDAVGKPVVVLNSLKSTFELLERRASNYSDRPRFIMANEILSGGMQMVMLNRTDPLWRRMRRATHENLTREAVKSYHSTEIKEAVIFTSSLLSNPDHATRGRHLHRFGASTIMSFVYDYTTLESEHDEAVEKIEKFNERISLAGSPGTYWVEFFPWMRHIPARFAKWKRDGLRHFAEDLKMFSGLVDRVRSDRANGADRPSFCASMLQFHDRHGLTEPQVAMLAGALFAAGSETTPTTVEWLLLALTAFPEVQQRAQAEIDTMVGRDRTPTLADAPNLPYVHAVVREIARWRPALALGIPHATTGDDWYEGMFIPKGTMCLANLWQCNHDRAIFGADADEFKPERHLDESGDLAPGPVETYQEGHVAFGFGRRICVGRHLARDSLFVVTAMILWAVRIERARGENGEELPLDLDSFIDLGFFVRPVPYECRITPRFPEVPSILAEEREHHGN
ncbi:cytochrome P450 [Gloeopeniophorella convolvens]|nr:cytochrome P450 [Gloeopeniophorella convolvens]